MVVASALGDIAVAIFAAVAALHLFWALGGKWGKDAAVPQTATSKTPVFRPGKLATLLVALVLAVAAAVVAARVGLLSLGIPDQLVRLACGLLALGFLGRAIGDFRYVGFFKRIKGTRFARLDSIAYSPLCLFVAIAVGATVP